MKIYVYMYHVSYIYKSSFLMYWPIQKKSLKSFAIPSLLNLPNISDPKTFNKQHVESDTFLKCMMVGVTV